MLTLMSNYRTNLSRFRDDDRKVALNLAGVLKVVLKGEKSSQRCHVFWIFRGKVPGETRKQHVQYCPAIGPKLQYLEPLRHFSTIWSERTASDGSISTICAIVGGVYEFTISPST